MVHASVAKRDKDNFVDRRAAERYPLEISGILYAHEKAYPIVIRDVSVYGLGVSLSDIELDAELNPEEMVDVEWGRDRTPIHASVVWSYKGRCGLVIKPALDKDHPLIMKGKELQQ